MPRRQGKIAIIKPHNPVSSATIALWLRDVLQQAEIEIGIFGAHSIRGALSSAAMAAEVTPEGSRLEHNQLINNVLAHKSISVKNS